MRGSFAWPAGDALVKAALEDRGTSVHTVSVYDKRLPLPPGIEGLLRHPEWGAETVRAYWYWWPMSEAW